MNNVIQIQQIASQVARLGSAGQSTGTDSLAGSFSAVRFIDLLSSEIVAAGELAMSDQLKKTAETLSAQMNAELMTTNPLYAAMLIEQSVQSGESNVPILQNESLPQVTTMQQQALLSDLAAPVSDNPADVLLSAVKTINEQPASNGFSGLVNVTNIATQRTDTLQLVAPLADGATGQSALLQAQTQFGRSCEAAQRLLDISSAAESADLDVDQLQQLVNSGTFLPRYSEAAQIQDLTATTASATPLNADEIFSQIKSSATQHIRSGDNDFTIKLSPEGLGDITVKLTEESGKVTLSLAASNPNVQRLLNSELPGLRDIMRPYNVEVSQVVQSGASQSMDMQQQLQQQFSHNGYGGNQQQSHFVSLADFSEEAQADVSAQTVAVPDAVLDAYV